MDRKIKIMYIVEPTSAGVGKHITDILENIDTEKFEVYFVYSSIRSDSKFKKKMEILNQRDIIFYKVDMVREISLISDFIAFIKIVKYIKIINPEVIHSHSSKAGFLGRMAGAFCRTKVNIYSPHAFPFNNYINKNKRLLYTVLEKIAGIFTTTIVATSETEYEQAMDNNIVKKDKLSLICNGINLNDYKGEINKDKLLESLGVIKYCNKDTKIIGYISRLVDQKDPNTLIKALSKLKNRNYIALICGEGELADEIRSEIKNLNIEDRVFMLGYMNNFIDIIKVIDVFVLPSLWEGLPYILLETMICKKIVVASNIVGNRDIVKNEVNGFLFEPKDYSKLSQILNYIIENYRHVDEIRLNAHEYVFENHNIVNMVKKLEDLYAEKITDRSVKI